MFPQQRLNCKPMLLRRNQARSVKSALFKLRLRSGDLDHAARARAVVGRGDERGRQRPLTRQRQAGLRQGFVWRDG